MKFKMLVLCAVTALTACATTSEHESTGHAASQWSYEGDIGPEKWASLRQEYALCGSGQSQSPINISDEKDMGLKPIKFHYAKSTRSRVINNEHTIQVNYEPGSYAVIANKKYHLLQFHFHSPSEHQIYGQNADMVAHLVHKSSDGLLAVVAVLFDKGTENAFLKPVWQAMPENIGEAEVSTALDIKQLLPAKKTYYTYSGSLTTPPCSENVNWNIMKQHVSVSDKQVSAFTDKFPISARPIQLRHGRFISVVY